MNDNQFIYKLEREIRERNIESVPDIAFYLRQWYSVEDIDVLREIAKSKSNLLGDNLLIAVSHWL